MITFVTRFGEGVFDGSGHLNKKLKLKLKAIKDLQVY